MSHPSRGRRREAFRSIFATSAAAAALVLSSVIAGAQAPANVWEGAYTEAQAIRGATVFGQSCGNCHTLEAQGRRPLTGDKFWQSYTQRTVGDLLDYVRKSMPNNNPGSLSAASYNDVVALILQSNGLPAGSTELGPETASALRIVPKDGGGQLPANTLVGVVGCLARSGNDWVLTSATAPERIDKTGPRPEDATRPLGTSTVILKFVLTRLDSFAGQRMAVSGMLLGAGGVDGLNVTTVDRVAEACP